MPRFAYYERLSAAQKQTYRRSDAILAVTLPDRIALAPLVSDLVTTLASGKRVATAKAATTLVSAICSQLEVVPVAVKVRKVRPQISGGELHGLYTFAQDSKAPTIEVWMRTAANERVVAPKTFLRTLLHEVMHHLDVTLLGLDDSFHTQGFFRRESSLVRQLMPPSKTKAPPKPVPVRKPRAKQLGLFDK